MMDAHRRFGYLQELYRDPGRYIYSSHPWSDRTACQLLDESLDAQQQSDMRQYGAFKVVGSAGNEWAIKISGGCSGNTLMKTSSLVRTAMCYCAFPPGTTVAVAWLAQKLVIETDEREFRNVAVLLGPADWPFPLEIASRPGLARRVWAELL